MVVVVVCARRGGVDASHIADAMRHARAHEVTHEQHVTGEQQRMLRRPAPESDAGEKVAQTRRRTHTQS